jgi:hypothetical protein
MWLKIAGADSEGTGENREGGLAGWRWFGAIMKMCGKIKSLEERSDPPFADNKILNGRPTRQKTKSKSSLRLKGRPLAWGTLRVVLFERWQKLRHSIDANSTDSALVIRATLFPVRQSFLIGSWVLILVVAAAPGVFSQANPTWTVHFRAVFRHATPSDGHFSCNAAWQG